jgi:hypothetical protein
MPILVSTYEKYRGRGYETIAVHNRPLLHGWRFSGIQPLYRRK